MSMQKLIMSNPKLTQWFMSSMSANFWEKQGKKNAMKVFRETVDRVSAYQKFLKEKNIDPEGIKSIEDFSKLPIIDKKSYIKKFELSDLALDGKISNAYVIETSSGYSGKPFFWLRIPEEDALFPSFIGYAFTQFYKVDKISTLVIMSLGLGTWTAGEKMAQALRITATKNPLMTVITPGPNLEEVLRIVKELSHNYKQTVINGYPPFVKTVIDEGERQGVDWKKLNVKLGVGGEGYTEEWREYMAQKIGLDKKDLLGISGGYGAADIGMSIGREYPITVVIRKLALRNKDLSFELFGTRGSLPSLLQYNPGTFYIEEIENELIFTAMTGIPLVRYNIHDRGGIIKFADMIRILKKHNYDMIQELNKYGFGKKDIWKLPFYYVFGRTDGLVSLFGIHIYTENIHDALTHSQLVKYASGNFKMNQIYDKAQNQKLKLDIELKKGIKPSESLEKLFLTTIIKVLKEKSSEYNHLYERMREKINPVIVLHSFGDPEYFSRDSIKHKYT